MYAGAIDGSTYRNGMPLTLVSDEGEDTLGHSVLCPAVPGEVVVAIAEGPPTVISNLNMLPIMVPATPYVLATF